MNPEATSLPQLAALILALGRVNRMTRHPDGRPETDTDHTTMMVVIACAVATNHPELGLDIGRVAQFSAVHDLVEADAECGDTNSFGITPEASANKAEKERVALERICTKFELAFPWVTQQLLAYEAQDTPEARFVKYLDKVLPKLTQILSHGIQFIEMEASLEKVKSVHREQEILLETRYPEFAEVVGGLLRWACAEAETAYENRLKIQKQQILASPPGAKAPCCYACTPDFQPV